MAGSAELARHYLTLREKQMLKTASVIEYYLKGSRYGMISNNPFRHSTKPSQDGTREIKISLVGTTPGPSGDSTEITLPI